MKTENNENQENQVPVKMTTGQIIFQLLTLGCGLAAIYYCVKLFMITGF